MMIIIECIRYVFVCFNIDIIEKKHDSEILINQTQFENYKNYEREILIKYTQPKIYNNPSPKNTVWGQFVEFD